MRTTINEAPALTPKICGEASGLRVIACISTPATANAAPIIALAIILGIRTLCIKNVAFVVFR
ncbi:hypothetical protein JPSP43_08540 [Staphylococcus pseudintermedius]